ncbi:MAG: FAD-dependent oxidoreductase [Patescibacteria group bacterium]|nr:FAD-dependent oxidoreductase [Patescibacteria group bacterium]MDD5715902.1 FAD-dependent oxidoreductase [Patescibacteria group bacterium]
MIGTYRVTLREKRDVADGTVSLHFDRPAGFEYAAGQFATLVNDDQKQNDGRGNRRPMSIGSSPTENEIQFAMRLSDSAYKRGIKDARPGCHFSIIGPAGELTLPENPSLPIAFIAGGVGIVPFRGMAKYAIDTNQPHDITLFYLNRTPRGSPYLDELRNFAGQSKRFRFVPIMTACGPDDAWDGLRGHLDEPMLKNALPDIVNTTYMLVGTPGMLTAVVALLEKLCVPREHILTEKFTGY